MRPGASHGPRPGVIAAMERASGDRAMISEGAKCPLCNARLEINTDEMTRLVERCDTPTCPNHRWHLVRPNPQLLEEERPGRKARVMRNVARKR